MVHLIINNPDIFYTMVRAFLFLIILFLSSCTFFQPEGVKDQIEEQEESSPEEVDVDTDTPSPELVKDLESAIEIEWRVPKTKVTRYILRYGKSPDNLDSEVEIELGDIKEVSHPVHGKLYKYLLLGFPSKSVIFYTLQAENEFGLSEPTPVAKEEGR